MLKWLNKLFSYEPIEDTYWTIVPQGYYGYRMVFDTQRAIRDGKFGRQFKAAAELAKMLEKKKPTG